ncbi:MAG: DJ-1/PfpI family protein [Candidatus Bathyarchaeia archaeon]
MPKVYEAAIIVFPRVEELDFTGVWQVLGTTQHLSKEAYFKLRTVGTIKEPVRCAHGLTVLLDEPLISLSEYDVIVVPGGPGTSEVMKNEALLSQVRQAYKAGKLVCSVCTGAFILAKAGVLKGKKATTYHTKIDELSSFGAVPVRERVVVQGNIITGAGVSASLDVGLKIVEKLLGAESATKVAEWIEYRQ